MAGMIFTTHLVTPGRTFAHCTGSAGLAYAWGDMDLTQSANGARADIQWTNPDVCSDNSSHSISLVKGDGWIQIGWWKVAGFPSTGYCEYQHPTSPNSYDLIEFSISHATHAYKVQFDSFDGVWDCLLDGSGVVVISSGPVGFTSTTGSVGAQGETHAEHGQIGKNYPAKLLFSDMQYRRVSDGGWPAINLIVATPEAPYGADEPTFGQLRVWTNPH
jgi:hypothetical protein